MGKKIIIHFNNLPVEVKEAIRRKYPDGYLNHIIKVTKPNNDFFHAVTVDVGEISYLVRVDMKVDAKMDIEELANTIFTQNEKEEPAKEEENIDQIEAEGPEES
jgi:hypothetical protein